MQRTNGGSSKQEKTALKLDLACGQRKREGFTGVDKIKVDGVDVVWDLEKFPYPFEADSVDEINCAHYIEHTSDLIAFMQEIYRILKVGGQCTIVAPYYSSMRAWQDPTHRRAISEATFLYFNKAWREQNKLDHYGITADFDFTYGYVLTPEFANRSEDTRTWAVLHYINVVADIHIVLTKRASDVEASLLSPDKAT